MEEILNLLYENWLGKVEFNVENKRLIGKRVFLFILFIVRLEFTISTYEKSPRGAVCIWLDELSLFHFFLMT